MAELWYADIGHVSERLRSCPDILMAAQATIPHMLVHDDNSVGGDENEMYSYDNREGGGVAKVAAVTVAKTKHSERCG